MMSATPRASLGNLNVGNLPTTAAGLLALVGFALVQHEHPSVGYRFGAQAYNMSPIQDAQV